MENRIEKLKAKPVKKVIKGVEVEVRPLRLIQMDTMLKLSSNDDKKVNEGLMEIIRYTLKEAFPEATDKDLDEIGMDSINELQPIILEINGLKKKDQK